MPNSVPLINSVIKDKLDFLYQADSDALLAKIHSLIRKHGFIPGDSDTQPVWTEKQSVLITYGDSVLNKSEHSLETLYSFLRKRIGDVISGVHILPFFPYSSDDGFSVIDFREVRDDLGDWSHINTISGDYRLMADLVINHVSCESSWFNDFKKGIPPASGYFIEEDPATDLSKVTRPRKSPLLTEVKTDKGVKHVWTTFSADQVDLDFSNPAVLLEFIDIILMYISNGISVIRLDAIAYLWKKAGTSCIHLPETHEVVKLIRALLDMVAPGVTIITETNVPHTENISYFGDGDEAHMIYQFSLPPLLLHALTFGDAQYLTNWAMDLDTPASGCYYFNFLASHDGVGVRPLEGLVPDDEFNALVDAIPEKGGFVSRKKNSDGSESPYELNITYFSALADPGEGKDQYQIPRFLCAHSIMFSLQGVPGIYIHSLTATSNDLKGVEAKGHYRAINRKQWDLHELNTLLEDPSSDTSKVFSELTNRLTTRSQQAAFHPAAKQDIIFADPALFVVLRTSTDGTQKILSISNVTSLEHTLSKNRDDLPLQSNKQYENLIGYDVEADNGDIILQPYETMWLDISK